MEQIAVCIFSQSSVKIKLKKDEEIVAVILSVGYHNNEKGISICYKNVEENSVVNLSIKKIKYVKILDGFCEKPK